MNERMQEILKKALERLDLVVTGVLFGLLVLTIYLYYQESSYIPDDPPPPQPNSWEVQLPMARVVDNTPPGGVPEGEEPPQAENQDEFSEINNAFLQANDDINSDSEARRVIVVNMFNLKTVDDEGLIAELNRRYNEAEQLYRNGQSQEALAIVEEILLQDPNHLQSLDLRDRINEEAGAET